MLRIFRLDDAFSEILELEASTEDGKQLQQKVKKRIKMRGEEIKNQKAFSKFDICACQSKNVLKSDACG